MNHMKRAFPEGCFALAASEHLSAELVLLPEERTLAKTSNY